MPNTYTLISSNVLTSSAASVTFSAIPSTYTDLVIRVSVRSDRVQTSDNINIRFNGDSAANYFRMTLTGNGSSPSSSFASSVTEWDAAIINSSTSASNTFGNGEYYISNYTSTSSRPGSFLGVQENNDALAFLRSNAYLYQGSAAISSIVMTSSSTSNFVSGSSFYLYGIKNS
jgi:hypothetical protein